MFVSLEATENMLFWVIPPHTLGMSVGGFFTFDLFDLLILIPGVHCYIVLAEKLNQTLKVCLWQWRYKWLKEKRENAVVLKSSVIVKKKCFYTLLPKDILVLGIIFKLESDPDLDSNFTKLVGALSRCTFFKKGLICLASASYHL